MTKRRSERLVRVSGHPHDRATGHRLQPAGQSDSSCCRVRRGGPAISSDGAVAQPDRSGPGTNLGSDAAVRKTFELVAERTAPEDFDALFAPCRPIGRGRSTTRRTSRTCHRQMNRSKYVTTLRQAGAIGRQGEDPRRS